MRQGMSFTLTMVVTAVVLLAAAFLIISISQSSFGDIGDFFRTSSDQSETSLLRQECLTAKERLCEDSGVDYASQGDLKAWADEAAVDGTSCSELAERQDIFGPNGINSIPACDTRETSRIMSCVNEIEEYCDEKTADEETWQDAEENLSANCLEQESLLSGIPEVPATC